MHFPCPVYPFLIDEFWGHILGKNLPGLPLTELVNPYNMLLLYCCIISLGHLNVKHRATEGEKGPDLDSNPISSLANFITSSNVPDTSEPQLSVI